jgi:predicted nucleic acid-binding protein
MSAYVVDASVAAKWFLQEDYSDSAVLLLDKQNQLHSPDFLMLEIDSLVLKRIRRGDILLKDGRDIRKAIRSFPLFYHSYLSLLDPAWEIAKKSGCSVYDCLYVALGILLNCTVVTADRTLFEKLKRRDFADSIMWVEELKD